MSEITQLVIAVCDNLFMNQPVKNYSIRIGEVYNPCVFQLQVRMDLVVLFFLVP